VKKILAIDDQVEITGIIADILDEHYEVYPAKTTTKAFALMHENNFDLILLDILMPGMNGIEFLSYLKKQFWYDNTPVIFVSSEADFDTVAKAANLGADGYIKKPIEKDLLLKKVRMALGE
jgi:putative two-component system response regulator